MKKMITLMLFISICTISSAQKTTVGILPATNSGASSSTAESIEETVTNAFTKAKRFDIVDRSKLNAIQGEKELQKSEDFMDGKVVEQSASLGAEYLIATHIISAEAVKNTGSSGTSSYQAKLKISLKVIDVATGQIVSAETIEPKAGSVLGAMAGIGASSAEAAISKAIKKIEGKVDEFVSKNFPLTVSIFEITAEKKGKASELVITAGSSYGLKKKDKFKVVSITEVEIDGKKISRKKKVGQITVKSVDDENFSTCQVKDGGDAILSKMNSGAKLKCISID